MICHSHCCPAVTIAGFAQGHLPVPERCEADEVTDDLAKELMGEYLTGESRAHKDVLF